MIKKRCVFSSVMVIFDTRLFISIHSTVLVYVPISTHGHYSNRVYYFGRFELTMSARYRRVISKCTPYIRTEKQQRFMQSKPWSESTHGAGLSGRSTLYLLRSHQFDKTIVQRKTTLLEILINPDCETNINSICK